MSKNFTYILLLLLSSLIYCNLFGQMNTIKNDNFWYTINGNPINSQGGGILKYVDKATNKLTYYWYGAYYLEADSFRNNPTKISLNPTFQSVTCYSSTDLVNWKFEKDVLTKTEIKKLGNFKWAGRLGVTYFKEINKYALLTQCDSSLLIALAGAPNGDFKCHQKVSLKQWIGYKSTGDQTVFTDEDNGKSYLVYSKPAGRNKVFVSEIGIKDGKVDILDCTLIFEGQPREGNCMFKYNNKFYMCASNIYGWDGSYTYYLTADSIKGKYTPTNNMLVMKGCEDDFSHIAQTGFFVNLKGTKKETVVYCGDRWANFAGNGLGYNQWMPISFNGTMPVLNSLNSWQINATTGQWKVAANNDFVKNGSFEADRRRVPTYVKPDQTHITGWKTEVLLGNKISLDSSTSPKLNYFNTVEDRQVVIGEKSLYINDNIAFSRKISQKIATTKFVSLCNGNYTLTAKVKNSKGFDELYMFVKIKGKINKYNFLQENKEWTAIVINGIKVKNGKVEIGFTAKGNANSFCIIDDVSLIKINNNDK